MTIRSSVRRAFAFAKAQGPAQSARVRTRSLRVCATAAFLAVASFASAQQTVVANFSNSSLTIVDLSNGDRTVLSSGSVGEGTALASPVGTARDASGNIYIGGQAGAITRVDPATGNRTVISSASIGTGQTLTYTYALAVEPSGQLIASLYVNGIIVRVDPTTGNRTVLASASVGSGTVMGRPWGLLPDTDGTIVYNDFSQSQLVRLDPATGVRTVISSATVGTGPVLNNPSGLLRAGDGSFVVANTNSTPYLIRVDPATGNRTVISSDVVGTGAVIGTRYSVAIDNTGGLYVADFNNNAIVKIDPTNGNRTTISSASVGTGPALNGPLGMLSGAVAAIAGDPAPVISSATTASGTYGSAFSYTITAEGSPTSFAASNLPAGLTLDSATGIISGTPTTNGSFSVGLEATTDGGTGTATLALTIAKQTLTVIGVTASNKTYDGGLTATVDASSGVLVGLVGEDVVTLSGTAAGTFASKTVGADKTVTVTGLTLAGADSGNYTLTQPAPTAAITAKSVTVTGITATGKTYNGSTTAALSTTNASLVGVVESDDATLSSTNVSGTFASSDAGTHTITISGLTLAGADAGNYTLTQPTSSATIAKAPLTVTAQAASRTYGAADPTFAATLSGFVGSETSSVVTGAAAFTTNATATSNADTYTITPAVGTLSATNYAFTTFNTGVLTIAKAVLTVTADAKTRVYGDSEPNFTATITGLVNNDTSAAISGAPAFSTNALVTSNVGAYTITPALGTLAATNYSFSFATGTLSVTKAALTVTAADKTKIYGAANPAFTATFSGFKNTDTAAVITGTPAFTTLADATSNVDTYAIDVAAGTLAATNYSFTYAAGTLTVGKAPLTVTADDKSRGYGAANPEFTAVVAGFVNDDTLDSATTGAPVLSTTAEATSPQGSYAISVAAGTLAASNYDFSLVDGTLAVTKAVLTVTADDKSKIYGAVNPVLTYTIAGYLNDDTAAVVTGTPALSTTADHTSVVATYAITVDLSAMSATNYTLAAAPGTLTVTPATLTVTAADKSRLYGAADPVFTATFSGFVNGDTATVVTGAPSFSTAAVAISPVGEYAITPAAGDLAAANYLFAFADGTLAVTTAPLTVTADNKVKNYGAALPALSATLTGFVNNETLETSGVAGTASFATTATAASAVDTYAIVPGLGTLEAANYHFASFVDGTLTVEKAVLTVTANSVIRSYGESNPALSVSYTGFVNGDSATSLTTRPNVTTSATSGSSPGSYALVVTGGSSSSYTLNLVDGSLTIVHASQSISFAGPGDMIIGSSSTLSASASSGLPVSFSIVSGPATISGNKVTGTGMGAVVVRASQPGDNNYSSAASVDRSFTVTISPTVITTPEQTPAPTIGRNAELSVVNSSPGVNYQWQRNGAALPNATGASLTLGNVQPPTAGLYTYTATVPGGGAGGTSEPVIVGLSTTEKVVGNGEEIGADIVHPNGNTYDQVLLEGVAATLTANPNQITRISFLDMSDDIVQVEFSGAGTLSLVMDNASAPAPAAGYNQSGVNYVKGHVGIVVTGADETTNVSVVSVGRMTAVNQTLFIDTVDYDGIADLAFVAIQSTNGKFGGVRTGNANYFATQGVTGVYAPGVEFLGPLYVGDISAFDDASPVLVVGAVADAAVAGGSLFQPNGRNMSVSGLPKLKFVPGTTSHGRTLPAQANEAVLIEGGVEVTSEIVVTP